MTKIIFVTDYLSFATGGTRSLVNVLIRLSDKFEVKIIAGITDSDVYIHLLKKRNIEILNLKTYKQYVFPSSQPINALKFLAKSLKLISNTIDRKEYILHFNNHIPCLLAYKLRISNNTTPTICSLHHLEDINSLPTLISKVGKIFVQDIAEVNGPYDLIHTVSNYTKKEIEKIRLINKKSIVVIPPGLELEKYLNTPRKAEGKYFVMIGRLEPRKHYDHAIFAVKYATKYNQDIRLYIIGDGPLRSAMTELIKRLSLEKNVFLLGKVDEETKLRLLSRAQALIHLGYPEGFGIVLVEALATGVPVLAYDVPPLNEVVKHGITGLLIERNNIKRLAEAMIQFHKYEFDERTLRLAAKRYDIGVISTLFLKVYTHLAQITKP